MLVRDIYGGDCDAIGLKGDAIAASFGQGSMQREEERYNGPMFFLRYIGALLRHYEEGFWLILLAILNSLPGVKHLVTVRDCPPHSARRPQLPCGYSASLCWLKWGHSGSGRVR